MAVTPCPPAAQIEINPRTGSDVWAFFSASCLANWATILAPVAANGWPSASELPTTLSLLRSMLPSGASRPSFVLQNSADSHAFSVHSTCAGSAERTEGLSASGISR